MMQQREQNDDRDRNAQQPEKYQTHGDLLSHGVLRPVFACANHALPGAVAQLPAFDGGEPHTGIPGFLEGFVQSVGRRAGAYSAQGP